MREDRQQLAALHVIKKSRNLLTGERTREPLHVVLHEYLDRGAIDGAAALDRHMNATADRHVGAEQNFLCHVERSRDTSHCQFLNSKRFLDLARNDKG